MHRGVVRNTAIAVGICIIVAVFFRLVLSRNYDSDFQLARATYTDFEIVVSTVGTLDAERSHMVSSSVKGDKGKIIYLVDDGTMVKAGDVLVRLDPTPFEAEILRLTGEVKSRESVVEAVKQVLAWEKSQAEGGVTNAEFHVKDSRQEYGRYMEYIRDLEELGRKGFSYPSEMVQAQRKAEQLNAKLHKAETDLGQIAKEGVFKVAGAIAAVTKAQNELQSTKTALEEAQGELKKTLVTAPSSGIAVHYELFRDSQKRKPRVGDTVWQNQPLLYLPDISSLLVKTQVREVDLHKISLGQKATLQVDAYPDILFHGDVTSIGVLGTEGAEGAKGEKYFQVNIAVQGRDMRLRPGMTARIFINTDRVRNVLAVPVQAVFDENGGKYCYLYKGKGFKRVAVTVGRENEDMAAVVAGLKNGDRVSLIKPRQEELR